MLQPNISRAFALALMGCACLAASLLMPAKSHAAAPPDTSRIASIGGDVTEILYALGFEPNIVAVDSTSVFPKQALQEKKSLGYMRALSTEGVLSVSPTLIVATEKAGPPEVIAALKESSVRYETIASPDSAEGIDVRVRAVAELLGVPERGEETIQKVHSQLDALEQQRAAVKRPTRVLFLLSLQGGRAIAAGSGTAAHEVIALAGGVNVVSDLKGYKPLSDEAALALQPDVILMMDRNQQADGPKESIEAQMAAFRGLSSTPAARDKRIYEVDGAALLQFGPRTAEAVLSLLKLLHPEIEAAKSGN